MADAPVTREYSLKSLVVASDPEHYEPDESYQFSNGRKFKTTDETSESGIYE